MKGASIISILAPTIAQVPKYISNATAHTFYAICQHSNVVIDTI